MHRSGKNSFLERWEKQNPNFHELGLMYTFSRGRRLVTQIELTTKGYPSSITAPVQQHATDAVADRDINASYRSLGHEFKLRDRHIDGWSDLN